mgnify:CR=1 FL=1
MRVISILPFVLFGAFLPGCLPDPEVAPAPDPKVFDSLVRLEEMGPDNPPAPAQAAAPGQAGLQTLWPSEQADWQAGGSEAALDFDSTVMRLEGGADAYLENADALGLHGPSVDSLVLELRTEDATEVTLGWLPAAADWGWAFAEGQCHTTLHLESGNEIRRYRVQLRDLPQWNYRVIDRLRLVLSGPGAIEIHRITVRLRLAEFDAGAYGALLYRAGKSLRPCLYMRCPLELSYTVRVPWNGKFSAGLGIVAAGTSTRFEVRIGRADEPLWRRTVSETGRWLDAHIDLSRYAGREVKLRLSAQCEAEGQIALWSNPVLYRAAPPGERPPNILLYLVDALRADRLSCYGYARATSPRVDALAERGARFAWCFSNETCTKPSVASISTGVTKLVHGFECFKGIRIFAGLETFPHLLRDQGYATGVISENPFAPPETGERRDYSTLDSLNEVTASLSGETQERAIAFLERHRDRPFFLYVHTMECHGRRTPELKDFDAEAPEPWRAIFDKPYDYGEAERYDASIYFADHNFGKVLDALARLGLDQNTIVIFTSDHGEALGERGEWGHGKHPYTDQIHIPLVIAPPNPQRPGAVVDTQVQLLDLAPTILHYAGPNRKRMPHAQGKSLHRLLQNGDAAARFYDRNILAIDGWVEASMALLEGPWKLFLEPSGEYRLVHFLENPSETGNLSEAHPGTAARLTKELEGRVARQKQLRAKLRAASDTAEVPVDPAKLEVIEALGYLD